MNALIGSVLEKRDRIESLKKMISKSIKEGKLHMSFSDSQPRKEDEKTFSDASEFWSSHDNWGDRGWSDR